MNTSNAIVTKNANEVKKRRKTKRKLVLKKKKTYELPEELWSVVKEYAGVYSITTKWNKIMNVGVDKLHDYYKDAFKYRVGNYKRDASRTKRFILKSMMRRGMNEDKYKKLAALVDKEKNPAKDFSIYKVGEEVQYTGKLSYVGSGNYYAGIITKVNKASITFKPYKVSHTVSNNPDARETQSYETRTHYYDKTSFGKPMTVRSSFCTRNTLPSYYKDESCFDYYKTWHDYGW